MRLKSLIFALIVLSASTAFGQLSRLEKANIKFDQLAFSEAIELYKKALYKDDENEAVLRIADCYRLLNDPVHAEEWYERTLTAYPDDALSMLYYAQALQQNENYKAAKYWYEQFAKKMPEDSRGHRGAMACADVSKLKNRPALFASNSMNFNTENAEFGPSFYKDGITFTSDRKKPTTVEDLFSWTNTPFLDVFVAYRVSEARWSEPEIMRGTANTLYHDGPVSFSHDYSRMFFTRNNFEPNLLGGTIYYSEDGVVKLKIMSAWWDETNKVWGPAQEVDFNNDNYSVAHPSIAHDGKAIYFSSDMPGGFGGTDIYVSYFKNGFWGKPVNLGKTINTEGNEMFPYISADTTLYFTSDVHPGMGGQDVFKAYYNKKTNEFENVWNLGAPINSPRDDLGFIINDDNSEGFYSSSRSGGKGKEDIYSHSSIRIFLDITVIDKWTRKPIKGAKVRLTDGTRYFPENDNTTNAFGKYYYVIDKDAKYPLVVSKNNYYDEEKRIDTRGMKAGETVKVVIEMESSLDIVVEGRSIVRRFKKPLFGAKIKIINVTLGTADSTITPFSGEFSFRLYPDCLYKIVGTRANYRGDEVEFDTEGLLRATKIYKELAFVGDDPYNNNFNHVYFELNKSNLTPNAISELESALALMKLGRGQIVMVLNGHADVRGSTQFNLQLSKNRAKSVRNWMVANGIDKSLVEIKPYADLKPVNKCKEGVKCEDYEHQCNRRVEFIIIDRKDRLVANSDPACAGVSPDLLDQLYYNPDGEFEEFDVQDGGDDFQTPAGN